MVTNDKLLKNRQADRRGKKGESKNEYRAANTSKPKKRKNKTWENKQKKSGKVSLSRSLWLWGKNKSHIGVP